MSSPVWQCASQKSNIRVFFVYCVQPVFPRACPWHHDRVSLPRIYKEDNCQKRKAIIVLIMLIMHGSVLHKRSVWDFPRMLSFCKRSFHTVPSVSGIIVDSHICNFWFSPQFFLKNLQRNIGPIVSFCCMQQFLTFHFALYDWINLFWQKCLCSFLNPIYAINRQGLYLFLDT